jgi:undecaprenyl-diphosphatase
MKKKHAYFALGFLLAFGLWTVLVTLVDVQPIGPEGSRVGFAALNRSFHSFTGVHMGLYTVTDWLGLIPVAFGFGFALVGLVQWIKRRSLRKVDRSILILGGFYMATLAAYLFFESWVINYRPVLIEGVLEASYPSSTTMLALCVLPTGLLQLRTRLKNSTLRIAVCWAIRLFTVFMVVGRLFSGVHWLTDILGGCLLSAALVHLYIWLA